MGGSDGPRAGRPLVEGNKPLDRSRLVLGSTAGNRILCCTVPCASCCTHLPDRGRIQRYTTRCAGTGHANHTPTSTGCLHAPSNHVSLHASETKGRGNRRTGLHETSAIIDSHLPLTMRHWTQAIAVSEMPKPWGIFITSDVFWAMKVTFARKTHPES